MKRAIERIAWCALFVVAYFFGRGDGYLNGYGDGSENQRVEYVARSNGQLGCDAIISPRE